MEKLKQRVGQIYKGLEESANKIQIDSKIQQISDLEREVSSPEIWNNPQNAKNKTQQLANLKKNVQPWLTLRVQIKDIIELIELGDDDLEKEFIEQIDSFETDLKNLKRQLLFKGEYDDHNATIRITSGVGGTDAQDFAEMLERMYLRWAEKSDFKTESIERSKGEDAGIKTSVFDVDGLFAYGKLKSENGVHRLVRISPFNSGGSRETSFALVEILPKIDNFLGKPLLILFFSLGCPGCMGRAVPYANRVVYENGAKINVVGIHTNFEGIEVSLEKFKSAKEEHYFRFPFYKDYNYDTTFLNYGAGGTPHWVLADEKGIAVYSIFGSDPNNALLRLDYLINELILKI